jgi:biopolymer transport protein ExbB
MMLRKFACHRMVLCAFVCAVFVLAAGEVQAAAAGRAPTATSTTESFFEGFFLSRVTHANGDKTVDIIGSTLLWILIALSAVNVGLIGYLALTNQRKNIVPAGVVGEVRRLLNISDYRQALELTRRDESFFSSIVHAGLAESSHGYAAIMRGLEQSAELLLARRIRPIELLYMFGQVSPMMGLLGTVYGIIFAFKVFVSMGGRASPALLAGGIGTALVATFWGLVVAIPALAAYSILKNKVDQLTMEAIVTAEELLSQFKPKTGAASAPTPPGAPAKPVLKPSIAAATNS